MSLPFSRILIAAAVTAAGLAAPGGGSPGAAGAAVDLPNVLLVTLDTARADRIGVYGYQRARTPVLDGLAREGVRFDAAFSPVPLTLPAHCSIMTGTYPSYHGVRDNSGFVLPQQPATLAEVLGAQGYRTAALVGAFVLDSKFGLARGFETYFDDFELSRFESVSPGYIQRRGDEVAAETVRWLEQHSSSGRPFFVWSHFYDPHDPYTPPEPYLGRHPGRPYDGEMEFTDANVGVLLDWLRRKGAYDNTLVIVAGDHGESLGEHGESKHGFFIYDSTLRVPLILKFPRGAYAGTVVRNGVSLVDLFPTVLQVVRRGSPEKVQGKGLLSLVLGKPSGYATEIYAECYYPRLQFGWSELRALITERYKYILAPAPELYDRAVDFSESRNLAGTDLALAGQLRSRLKSMIQRIQAPAASGGAGQRIDSETREKLRSLGYISMSMGGSAGEDFEARNDPKKEIGTYNLIADLFEESAKGNYRAVIPRYRQILARQPGLKILHYKLGQAYFQTGAYESALESYKRAVELGGDTALAVYDMALTYMKLERTADAIVGLTRTVELDPSHYRARTNLGVLLREQGKLEESVAQLEAAIAAAPRSVLALSNLAVSYSMTGRHGEAESTMRKAVELSPRDAVLRANLAAVLHRMGKAEEARREMNLARELHR